MARRPQRKAQVVWYGDEFLEIVRKHGDPALFAAGEVVQRAAVRRIPRVTGNLARSAYVSTRSRSTYVKRRYWRREKKPPTGAATVAFSAPHSHLIESGRRRSGVIAPRRKRALTIEGQVRSSSRYRRVRGRAFLGNALEETKTSMVEELAGVLRNALEREMPRRR